MALVLHKIYDQYDNFNSLVKSEQLIPLWLHGGLNNSGCCCFIFSEKPRRTGVIVNASDRFDRRSGRIRLGGQVDWAATDGQPKTVQFALSDARLQCHPSDVQQFPVRLCMRAIVYKPK